jgi:hypothetical protein
MLSRARLASAIFMMSPQLLRISLRFWMTINKADCRGQLLNSWEALVRSKTQRRLPSASQLGPPAARQAPEPAGAAYTPTGRCLRLERGMNGGREKTTSLEIAHVNVWLGLFERWP